MNIRIPILLSGGGLPPFVQYTPVTVNNAVNNPSTVDTKAKASAEDKGKLTDKDLLSLLKDIDGLPSDMQALYLNMQSFYALGGENNPLDTSSLSTLYIKAILLIKTAKYHKLAFEEAYKVLENNKGLNEVAMSTSGNLIVMDAEGNVKLKSMKELENAEPGTYQTLTNGELLRIRAERPDFAGNNTLTQYASNGIGMDKVAELVKSNLLKLGENTMSREGFVLGSNAEGIQIILQLMLEDKLSYGTDPEGLYKAKVISKELKSKIEGVLNYVYLMLPDNAKNLLKIKSGGAKEAYNMIYDMIASTTSSTNEMSLDYITDKEGHKPGEKAKAEAADNTDKTNPILNILNGIGGDSGMFTINKGTQAQMSVSGVNYRSMVDLSGKTILDTNLSNMLAESGLQGIVDKTSISFGNLVLNQDQVLNVIYRNSGGTRVALPSKMLNGKLVPDFDVLDEYNEVIAKVNSQCNETTPIEKRKQIEALEMRKAGLDQYLGADGGVDMSKFSLFFVTDGYATDNKIKIDENNKMVEEVDDDATYDYIDNVVNKEKKLGDSKDELDRFLFYKPGDWFGLYDKIYSASVYIPIVSNNKLLAITAYGKDVKYSTGKLKEEDYQRWQKLLNIQNTSSDLL